MLWFMIYLVVLNILTCPITLELLKSSSRNGDSGDINGILAFLSLAGGVIGFMAGFTVWRKKRRIRHVSKNLSTCVACSFAAFWLYFSVLGTAFSIWNSVAGCMTSWLSWVFWGYAVLINLLSFIWYGLDKSNAASGKERVPETNLLFKSFIGGAAGGLASMFMFRHKTRVWYFVTGNILMAVAQIYVTLRIMW